MRIIKFLFTLFFLLLSVNKAFSADLSDLQKKTYTELSGFLKEEGFTPSIDSDGTLCFKKEGSLHWIYVSKEQLFITVNRGGFKLGGEDGYDYERAIHAANTVNRELNAVKIYCSPNLANLSYELFARSIEDFKFVFYKSLELLNSARESFLEAYKAEKEVSSSSFTIVDIQVANVDKNGKIITNYGEKIYNSNTMYIKPNVKITSKISGEITVFAKFITPSGLSAGGQSPSGYTLKKEISLTEGKTESIGFSGWGGEKSGHWKTGTYKWEFWYNGECIGSKEFKIL